MGTAAETRCPRRAGHRCPASCSRTSSCCFVTFLLLASASGLVAQDDGPLALDVEAPAGAAARRSASPQQQSGGSGAPAAPPSDRGTPSKLAGAGTWTVAFDVSGNKPEAAAAATGQPAGSPAATQAALAAARARAEAAAGPAEALLQQLQAAGIAVAASKVHTLFPALTLSLANEADGPKLAALLAGRAGVAFAASRSMSGAAMSTMSGRPLPAAPAAASGSGAFDAKLIGIDEYNNADDWTQLAKVRDYLPKINGKGMSVGILDTGVDYRHPALGNCGRQSVGKNSCRVNKAYNFFFDDRDVTSWCDDTHGTHVTGIAAGNAGNIRKRALPWVGVAPKANIGGYAIAPCWPFVTWFIPEGIERAVTDSMDVINMSWGADWGAWWPGTYATDPLATAAAAGTLMAAAAGNEADTTGLFSVISPALEKSVLAVASLENTVVPSGEITFNKIVWGTSKTITARTLSNSASPPGSRSPDMPVVAADIDYTDPSQCVLLGGAKKYRGKAIVVPGLLEARSHPDCDIYYLLSDAADAKVGAIFIEDTLRLTMTYEIADNLAVKTQVFTLDGNTTGAALMAAAAAGGLRLKHIGPRVMVPVPRAKQVSSFSSIGPGLNLQIKPEIAAPGSGIWSTVGPTGYQTFRGTSMASPFMAGVLTLLKHKRGAIGVDDAKAQLMITAAPVQGNSPKYGSFLEPAVRVGAGLVQVHAALVNPTRTTPYQLQLQSGLPTQMRTVQLQNSGPRDITYKLGHLPAASVPMKPNWYVQEIYANSSGLDVFEQRPGASAIASFPGGDTVTVPAGGSASFQVTFTVSGALAAEPLLYSGYIVMDPLGPFNDDKGRPAGPNDVPPSLSLVYQGLSTSYEDLSVLAPYIPAYAASSKLRGADGGLYFTCTDNTTAPNTDCDTRGGNMDGVLTLNASAPWWVIRGVFAIGTRPIQDLRVQVINQNATNANGTHVVAEFHGDGLAGDLDWQTSRGVTIAVRFSRSALKPSPYPYTARLVVVPAGEGPDAAIAPAGAVQTYDFRGSLMVIAG